MQAVTEAGHSGQRGGFQQQQVLIQGRGTLGGGQTLNTLDQVSVLDLRLAHHLEQNKNNELMNFPHLKSSEQMFLKLLIDCATGTLKATLILTSLASSK